MLDAVNAVELPRNDVRKYLTQIAIVFAVQFAVGKIGGALPVVNSGGIGPVWPASGTALAALLLCGYRVWPGVALGAFLLVLWSPVSLVGALVYGFGTVLAALAGAFLLRRVVRFEFPMLRLRDAVGLIVFGAFGSSLISASIGVPVLYSAHVHAWSGFERAWLVYWLGDSMGVLLVTPVVLAFFNLRKSHLRARLGEMIALLVLLTMACFVIFGDLPLIPVRLHVMALAVLPFVIWAAICCGAGGAAFVSLWIASIATLETAHGSGPFALNNPFINAVLLDAFFAVLSISGLTLAAMIAEREEAERECARLLRDQAATEVRLRLAAIVESSEDAIIGGDLDGVITDWNKAAERLYGYSRGEVIGKPMHLVLPSDRSGEFAESMGKLKKDETVEHYETVRQRKDGGRIDISLTISPIKDLDGRIIGSSDIARDITERKHQQAVLHESEERFQLLADATQVMIWMSGADKLCTYFNKSWLDFTGRSVNSELGNGWAEGVHPDDRERCMEIYTQAFDRREQFRMEYRLRRHDGEHRWVLDIGAPRINADRSFAGYIGVAIDVTERNLAEEKLREYEQAVESSEDMIAVMDREYRYSLANRKFVRYRGMTKQEVVGHLVSEVLNEGVFENIVKEKLDECFRGNAVRFEMKHKYPEIGERDMLISYFPIQGPTGVDRAACILQDITERKRAEAALRESEERFRLAAQAGRMFAYEWDAATDQLMRSAESASILGFEPAEPLTGQQVLAKVHREDRERLLEVLGQLSPERPDLRISYRMLRLDGSVIWVERNSRAHFDEHGKMLRIVGMVTDITERKLTEEALRRSEERFRLAAQAGKMYAYEWDVATDMVTRSAEASAILGFAADVMGVTHDQLLAVLHPDDRAVFSAACFERTPEDPVVHSEYRMVRPDGSVVWLEKNGRAFFDQQGRLLRVVGMVADISDRKQAEAALASVGGRLIEAQEQERSRIARELHDDISQRLALLTVELERLQQELPDSPEEIVRHMGKLRTQTAEIAGDIQSLSHELHSTRLEHLGLVPAMRGFCKEFSEQKKVKIDFKIDDLPGSLTPEISLCLFRVMQEALHNSAKHSGVEHFDVGLWTTWDEIHLTVRDSGAGFDSEAAKEGRGLGLISMQERLKLLKGTLSIESQPKRGTTIHARVPFKSGDTSMRAAG